MTGMELAALFRRDLTRLAQELRALPGDGVLWGKPPGIANSIGNLVLHLEGNLRYYIARQLGGIPYTRQRDLEFSQSGLTVNDLRARVEPLATLIPEIIAALSDADLNRLYPEEPFNSPISTAQYLVSLNSHLNYHLGQIDYLRRILTGSGAIDFVQI
jgi:DinB superfamily